MYRIAATLSAFFIISVAAAQPKLLSNAEVFKVEDGLPQSFVTGIVQDRAGFIWVGTFDGIARYDGRSFTTIGLRQTGSPTFSSHVVNNMTINSNNHLTILYQGNAVDDFDPVSMKVKPIPSTYALREAVRQGIVDGVARSGFPNLSFKPGEAAGISWTDPVTGKLEHAGLSNGRLHSDSIYGVTQDSAGLVYILNSRGVEISKDLGRTFSFIPLSIPAEGPLFFFKQLLVLKDGSLLLRRPQDFLHINFSRKTCEVITTPQTGNAAAAKIQFLSMDHQSRPYFEHNGHVYRFEKDLVLKQLWKNDLKPSLGITACMVDRSDVLWVSINAQGLTRIDLLANKFYSYTYDHGFFVDVFRQAGVPASQVPQEWLRDPTHYYFYSGRTGRGELLLVHGQAYDFPSVRPIVVLRNGQLQPLKLPAGSNPALRGLAITAKDEIWSVDIRRKGLWYWPSVQSAPVFFAFDSTRTDNIHRTMIADLLADGDSLWISTHGKGLFLFVHGRQQSFASKYDISRLPDNLTDIYPDPGDSHRLWIGTRGDGLILFDKRTGVKQVFTEEDGLPNNTIYCILGDRYGSLWLSSNKGISRFDPRDHTSRNFVKTDGLAGNEFNRYHKFIFEDGRFALGGLDGFSVFNPGDFINGRNPLPVPIRITGIEINNIAQQPGREGSLIQTPLTELQSITLPYNRNFIAVSFAALQFNEPGNIRYRYKLAGADDDWKNAGFSNIANYTQLRPGTYTLMMNATLANGEWSPGVLELRIRIRPPLWATWWAYVLYIILAAILVRLYLHFHKHRVRMQQQLIFEQKEAVRLKELDESKDRFFSNITHEFRTPLTLIVTPLAEIEKQDNLPAPVRANIELIARNTRSLTQLINQYLDFSKLDHGRLRLNKGTGYLAGFISETVERFQMKAKQKNIRLSFAFEGENRLVHFDQGKMETLALNLLGNALKFTGPGGSIHVHLRRFPVEHVLTISDTGIGIAPDQLPRIFDRYHQAGESTHSRIGGTGIGLAYVKELAILMRGSISVSSIPGQGSTFTLALPAEDAITAQTRVTDPDGLPAGATALADGVDRFPDRQPADEGSLQPLVLLAEDSPDLGAYLRYELSRNYRVLLAVNGEQAAAMILEEMPDLVVSDVMMPVMNGLELAKMIKDDPRTAHIGMILLTSKSATESRIEGLSTGADDYLAKPFDLDELGLRMRNLLLNQQRYRKHLQLQLLLSPPAETPAPVTDSFLKQVYELLDRHIDDPGLNVDFLARQLAMSRSSLNRKLRALLDVSPNDLIKKYRLRQAVVLLAAGNDITGTSYKVGFNTPSYFAQCFREEFGMSPSEYLQNPHQ